MITYSNYQRRRFIKICVFYILCTFCIFIYKQPGFLNQNGGPPGHGSENPQPGTVRPGYILHTCVVCPPK